MIRRVLVVLLVTLVLGLAGPAAALAAQEASPVSAQTGSFCGVTPQPVNELVALAFPQSTPAASADSAIASTAEADLPQGAPVDATTATAVEEVVQSWLVCLVAGEGARLFALMTDKLDAVYLQQYISLPASDTPEELLGVLSSGLSAILISGGTSAFADVGRELRTLDDGRIGGIWSVDGNDAFFILEQQDGSWLIDEIIDIAE